MVCNYGLKEVYNVTKFDVVSEIVRCRDGIDTVFVFWGWRDELGLEKIVLTEGRLSVYLGAGIKYNLSAENNRTNNPSIPIRQQSVTSTTSSYGVTFFSGLAVNLSEHIFTNFDISPHLMYYRTKNSYFPGGNSGFDFSFQPDVFRLMLGYRLNH